jgi:hypothetical protein
VAIAVTLAVVVAADELVGGVAEGVRAGLALTCERAGVLVAVPVSSDGVAVEAPACAVDVPEGVAVSSPLAPVRAPGVPVGVAWTMGVSAAGWVGVPDVVGEAGGVAPGVAVCVAECRHTAAGSVIIGSSFTCSAQLPCMTSATTLTVSSVPSGLVATITNL